MGDRVKTGSPTRSGAFDGIVGIRVRRLQQALSTHWADWFGALGLEITPVQGGILLAIDDNPGLTQTALARLMQVETPTLSEALRPLAAAGWVTKCRMENDARAVALGLSAQGHAVARAVKDNVHDHESGAMSALTEAEQQMLIDLLDKALTTPGNVGRDEAAPLTA